ncbi:hypothetical protein [uncultured Nostoc sp.]|uniref:hypothetical protein n=1 Tax=uncultured Nostoc sp. TaxID=340711 RepID=UPI0035CA453C
MPIIYIESAIAKEYQDTRAIENTLLGRITLDLNICHGKSCIRGMRYPFERSLLQRVSILKTDPVNFDRNNQIESS